MSGAPGPGRALTLPGVVLLASPDDYLVELERRDIEATWGAAYPEGESRSYSATPPAAELSREIATRSLFAANRLLVVAASDYFTRGAENRADVKHLAAALATLGGGDTVLLVVVAPAEPEGPLAEAVKARGEVRWLPLPVAPKPWEKVRVTPDQRLALEGILRRVTPAILAHPEAVDALIEACGFRPRELAQLGERALVTGTTSAQGVRALLGVGECSLTELEDGLMLRDRKRLARLLAVVAAGGELRSYRGEAVAGDRAVATLANALARTLRQALAMRSHAERCGLARELDPARCSRPGWYNSTFKPRLHPQLAESIRASSDTLLAGLNPWPLHHVFRLAAAYRSDELLDALATLAGSGAERDRSPGALAALTTLVVSLVTRPAA